MVVALIDDSATVKTFYKENGHFRLQPENDTYEPIIVNEVVILGKVIASYRILLIIALLRKRQREIYEKDRLWSLSTCKTTSQKL